MTGVAGTRAFFGRCGAAALFAVLLPLAGAAQDTEPYPPEACPWCEGWNEPTGPVRVHGDTWYVGTRGLASILVTSAEGHVLLDGGLPASAPLIAENIRSLGFRVEDVRVIVTSHPHFDHAGGVAALKRMSGARVLGRSPAAPVLATGLTGPDDPQHDVALPFPGAGAVDVVEEGDTVRVGPVALVAHATAGHTPGGTSWSWRSCDDEGCLDVVYADSQTPVSADDFLFTSSEAYPTALADFEHGFERLESLPCDIVLTPHPGASDLWRRLEGAEGAPALVDPAGCRRYVEEARARLERRVRMERSPGAPRTY